MALGRRDTIRTRLLLLSIATAAPLLVSVALEVAMHAREAREAAQTSSLHTAQSIALRFEDEWMETTALLNVLAARPDIVSPSAAGCDPIFTRFTEHRPEFANLSLVTAEGRVVCSALPAPANLTFAQMPWLSRATRTNSPFVTGPVVSPILNRMVVYYVRPIHDATGFRGALVISVLTSRYAVQLQDPVLPADGIALVHDAASVIARSDDHGRWTGRSAQGVDAVKRAIAGETGVFRTRGIDGTDRIFAIVRLPRQQWWVQIGVPVKTVYAPVQRWLQARLLSVLAFLALSITLAVLLSRGIVRSIRVLADRAQHVDRTPNVFDDGMEGPVEIAQLGTAFGEMLRKRNQAEAELAKRERRYQTILDTTSDGIWASGADGVTTYVNPRMAQMLGRSVDEVIGTFAPDLFDGELGTSMKRRMARRTHGIGESYELRHSIGGSEVRWQVQSTPVLDAAGTYQGLVATVSDVTQQRLAEERALENEQQLESIFSSAMDGIIIIDDDQRVVMFNHAAELMFGVSASEAIGGGIGRFLPQRFRAAHQGQVRQFDESNLSRRAPGSLGEVFGLRSNGKEFPVEASISRVQAGGKRLLSVILRDVTARLESEHALRESEASLKTVVALTRAGVWEANLHSDSFRCDDRCAQILGFATAAEAPKTWSEARAYIHPEEQPRLAPAFARMASGEIDEFDAEYRIVRTSGDVAYVATLGRVVERLPNGTVRLLAASFDITPRKESEARLSQEMEFNRTLIDASPAFFVAFHHDGTIVSVNDAFVVATGYTREEIVGAEFIGMFIPPEEQAEARAVRERVIDDVEITLEGSIFTRSGDRLDVEWHVRSVFSASGELQFSFGVGLDITQRKRHESQLREHLGFLDALHETTLDLLRHRPLDQTMDTIVRRAAQLFDVPDAFLALLDHDRDGGLLRLIAGIGAAENLIGEQPDGHDPFVQQMLESSGPLVLDRTNWPASPFAERLPIRSLVCAPMRTKESIVGAIAMGHHDPERRFTPQQMEMLTRFAQLAALVVDHARLLADANRELSERARAEAEIRRLNANLEETVRQRTADLRAQIAERLRAEAELRQRSSQLSAANLELAAASKLKDEFLANMSHELRTPLNAFLGMSEVLEERVHGDINERQLRSVRIIAESGRHLLELINDILDLAKIESGTVGAIVETVSVRNVCEASLRMLREAALRKRIHLLHDLPETIETVDADERRLRQILVNLLSNAVKFTPEGGTVELSVRGDRARNLIRFAVHDTGIGIAKDQLELLFQPFVQLDSGWTRQYGGTGLGLSLVRRMAELHDGRIEVASEVGKGSTFTLVIPWRVSHDTAVTEVQATGSGGDGPVLIVEDDRTAAQMVARYLTDVGMPVDIWNEREPLIPLIERLKPRLIILDILLEQTTGWDVLTKIRSTPAIAGTPVVIVSIVDDSPRGVALGATGYLLKPIRRDQVYAEIARIFPDLRERLPNPAAHGRVLLAEDNEANIEVIEGFLTARGFEVVVARDGQAAVEAALMLRPAVILMDIQMPKMNGLDAIRQIREAEGQRRTPIIAVTALARNEDHDRCVSAGADDCLSKPLSLKKLEELLRDYVSRGLPS